MPNTYVNKVTVNGSTILDLTSDTVDAAHLAQGYTAHDRSGATVTGTMSEDYEIVVDPDSMVGHVVTGTAVTGEANYTPTGDVTLATQAVSVPQTVSLAYSYSNYVLTIDGITTTAQAVQVPTSATFHGSPVRLEAERSGAS